MSDDLANWSDALKAIRARADAVGVQQVKGVVLYRDAVTERTAAVFVEAKNPTVP